MAKSAVTTAPTTIHTRRAWFPSREPTREEKSSRRAMNRSSRRVSRSDNCSSDTLPPIPKRQLRDYTVLSVAPLLKLTTQRRFEPFSIATSSMASPASLSVMVLLPVALMAAAEVMTQSPPSVFM